MNGRRTPARTSQRLCLLEPTTTPEDEERQVRTNLEDTPGVTVVGALWRHPKGGFDVADGDVVAALLSMAERGLRLAL